MENNIFLPLAFVLLSSWLLLLSVLVYWNVLRKKKIPKLEGEAQLNKALENLNARLLGLEAKLEQLNQSHNQLSSKSIGFLQKVGFLRYNPFDETGGDQSYCVALLDGNNDGFVLTSLHSRSGTRNYAKQIKDGKNKQGFSKEEQKTIALAIGEEIKN